MNKYIADTMALILRLEKRKMPEQVKEKMKAGEFVDKWAGFLSERDTDKSKYDYLSEKYK